MYKATGQKIQQSSMKVKLREDPCSHSKIPVVYPCRVSSVFLLPSCEVPAYSCADVFQVTNSLS